MKVKFLGHSAFLLKGSKVVIVDPFLSGNPLAPFGPDGVTECDVVIVTHDHADHMGDAVDICKRTGAILAAQHEIAISVDGIKAEGMNIGGFVSPVDGVEVAFTPAVHSSATGAPMGAIIRMDGKTIYHAGDTGLFGDMKLIGEFYKPELALLPIGGRYTMDVAQAIKAIELIRPKIVVPMHYNTFPIIQADPEDLRRRVSDIVEVRILRPGEEMEL